MDDDTIKRLAKILGVAILIIFVFKFIGVRMATSVGERKLQRQQQAQPAGQAQTVPEQATPAQADPLQESPPATSPDTAPEAVMTQESTPPEGYPESRTAPQPPPGSEFPASERPASPATMPEPPAPADAAGRGAPPPEGGY